MGEEGLDTGVALIIISPKLSIGDFDVVLPREGIEGGFAARKKFAGVAVAVYSLLAMDPCCLEVNG